MHGRGDGVDEPLIGIRREVHKLGRAGRDSADDLNVQQDFAVSALRVLAGTLLPPSTPTEVTDGVVMPRLPK